MFFRNENSPCFAHVLFVTNAVIFSWKKLYINLSSENGAFQRRIFELIFVCGLHTVETEWQILCLRIEVKNKNREIPNQCNVQGSKASFDNSPVSFVLRISEQHDQLGLDEDISIYIWYIYIAYMVYIYIYTWGDWWCMKFLHISSILPKYVLIAMWRLR